MAILLNVMRSLPLSESNSEAAGFPLAFWATAEGEGRSGVDETRVPDTTASGGGHGNHQQPKLQWQRGKKQEGGEGRVGHGGEEAPELP